MKRQVIDREVYQPARTAPGSRAFVEWLECGHVIHRKASQGEAKHRQCSDCDHLRSGGRSWVEGEEIRWDADTQMPVWPSPASEEDAQ